MFRKENIVDSMTLKLFLWQDDQYVHGENKFKKASQSFSDVLVDRKFSQFSVTNVCPPKKFYIICFTAMAYRRNHLIEDDGVL